MTRKITSTLARIYHGSDEVLRLGNLNAKRDWGHAKDYVRGMWLMTEQPKADDYVLASGVTTGIRQFLQIATAELGWDIVFEGDGLSETGRDVKSGTASGRGRRWNTYRAAEVDFLLGDATKAKTVLGWRPEVDLTHLIKEMVAADLRRYRRPSLG